MNSLTIQAPAKVNLFLRVLNKRKSSSYHNILTLFEKISLSDDIIIRKIPKGIEVQSDKFITTSQKDNIAYRAAGLILNYKRIRSGVSIHIRKRIPIAAGLGGGSSDAASVLVGMNRLFGLKLKANALAGIAGRLGADVPFFILNAPFAIGTKRGDKLKSIELAGPLWHIIVYPGFKSSTKDIYEAYDAKDLTTKRGNVKIHPPSLKLRRMDFKTFQSMLHNDLEDTVIAKNAVVSEVLKRLASSLGRKAIVSGSGPSVFCLCRTRKEALEGRKRLFSSMPASQTKGWQVFIARTTS